MSIRAFRIAQRHLAPKAFEGEGARLYGGRWNHAGVPMVYTAATKSLAVLELLVHLNSYSLLGSHVCIPVDFASSLVIRLSRSELPAYWAEYPAAKGTRDIGSEWAESMESVVLEVPSAIVPDESNYLLNPRHREFRKLRIGNSEEFEIDARLMGG